MTIATMLKTAWRSLRTRFVSAFRDSWNELSGRTRIVAQRTLDGGVRLTMRATAAVEPASPPDLDPKVEAAVRDSIAKARSEFEGGSGLSQIAELAAKGVAVRAIVTEHFPREDGSVYLVSLGPDPDELLADVRRFTRKRVTPVVP